MRLSKEVPERGLPRTKNGVISVNVDVDFTAGFLLIPGGRYDHLTASKITSKWLTLVPGFVGLW